jgi:hypothetical protein
MTAPRNLAHEGGLLICERFKGYIRVPRSAKVMTNTESMAGEDGIKIVAAGFLTFDRTRKAV